MIPLIATSTGQRHYAKIDNYADDSSDSEEETIDSMDEKQSFVVDLWAISTCITTSTTNAV